MNREQIKQLQQFQRDAVGENMALCRPGEIQQALDHAARALEKLSLRMANADYEDDHFCEACGRKGIGPEQAGKTLAYVAKMINEITRLRQFAKGEADQRTEVVGLGDLLKVLSNDQFLQVQTWIEQRAGARPI